MIIEPTYPPNYDEIKSAFRIAGRTGIIFTWGNVIHNPSRISIPPDLIEHEHTHSVQQPKVGGPRAWWDRYIEDAEFRFGQELEAYRAQWMYAIEHYSREQRRPLLKHISKALAGPMYGHLVTPAQAKKVITEGLT